MSNSCQKNFALTIGTAPPVGPPYGALQVDAVTVAQQNTWASLINAHGNGGCPLFTYTGRLPFTALNTWQGDFLAGSLAQYVQMPPTDPNLPQNDFLLVYALYCGGDELGVASFLKPGPDPTGVYSIVAHQPFGNIVLSDGTILPNWFPSPPTTVTVTWATT